MSKNQEFMHITLQDTLNLTQQPGTVSIVIRQLQDYCMPFVFFNLPEKEPQGLGIIVHEGNFMVTQNAHDLATELQSIFPHQVNIILPELATMTAPTKHSPDYDIRKRK